MTTWTWDPGARLGGGGFGQVFEASGPTGRLAAKVVPKADGATREQLIGQSAKSSPYIIPILYVEETPDAYVLFMPRADLSLRAKIGAGITAGEAIAILTDVATALVEIAGDFVHRDIKPDNVLLWNGTWALCDFGIARYADAATAADTRKAALSPYYAAPEQWRHEHATSAADVYAFGVMAYELLSGQRPFSGNREDLREQHINTMPPPLPGNRKLTWLITECLQKAPEARPSAANLLLRLQKAGEDAASRGASALAAAQSAVLQAQANEQAERQQARTEQERRETLFASAEVAYSALVEQLVEFITDEAPSTDVQRDSSGVALRLGGAHLRVAPLLAGRSTNSPYDVAAYGEIRLEGEGRSRSHSIYYADFDAPRSYAWYELGFMSGFQPDFENQPAAMSPYEGLQAFDSVIGGNQLAWGIVQLDIGDLDRFIDFWALRFGEAAAGRFPRLYSLPDGRTDSPQRR